MNVEFEFQKHIFLKHIRFFALLVILLIASPLIGFYIHIDPTLMASLFVGSMASFLATLVFVYPDSRQHFLREHYKLLAMSEDASHLSKDLSKIIKHDILVEQQLDDESLRKIYSSKNLTGEVRSFMPILQEHLEILILSSPELDVETWETIYHLKRDIDAQASLSPGSNDLLFMAKALRMLEMLGTKSIFSMKLVGKIRKK